MKQPTKDVLTLLASVAILAGVLTFLAVIVGCAAGNKGVEVSRRVETNTEAPTHQTGWININTAAGGYAGLATLGALTFWRQKRVRETAANRMIRAIEHVASTEVKRIILSEGVAKGPNLSAGDAAERWINKEVKKL